MSPKSQVPSPKPRGRGLWQVTCDETQHLSRITHHASRLPSLRTPHSALRTGFTLIEIMIVVAIMGIVMTMSVPIVYKVWRKAPMREAVKDIVEVCSHARARAIMNGVDTKVVFYPKENRLSLDGASGSARSVGESGGLPGAGAPASSGSGLSAQLPEGIIIETLDVNMSGVEYNDAERVEICFHPNGISDELRMILFDGRDRMGIELEISTGLASIVPNPLREWTRR